MNDLIRWVQKNETTATGYGFLLFALISGVVFRNQIFSFFGNLF